MIHRLIPRWQTRLLRICLAVIVAAVFTALAFAPSVLRRNMETVDISALRSELFDLHLGVDAFRLSVDKWQEALLKGRSEERAALQLEERGQFLLHRLGVLLARPGIQRLMPENADTARHVRDRLAAAMARLSEPAQIAAARTRLVTIRNTDLLELDRYIVDAFHRLGRILSGERWQLTRTGLAAQRLSALLIMVGVLTLVTLWMQGRVLRRAASTLDGAIEDLAEARRIAHIGNVRLNHRRDEVTWSGEFARIFGLDADGVMTVREFEALIHPLDRERVIAAKREALARSAGTGEPARLDTTFLAYRSDGVVIELEVRSELIADANGKPLSMVSTVRDITEEGRARRALHDSERNLATAQRIARLGSFRHNYRTERTVWSQELYFLLGRDPEKGPLSLKRIVHPDDHERIEELFSNLLRQDPKAGQRQLSFECRVLHGDGGEMWIRGTAEMAYDDGGRPAILTGSLQDVTSEVEQERILRNALLDAERANRAKSEFLAIMSHELRTPMNGIMGMLAAIESRLGDGTPREQIRIAQSSARALLVILNDVLDMSKIEAGRLEIEAAPFDLRALIKGTTDLYAETARSKGLVLVSRIGVAAPAWLLGDAARIRQILANLVSNAVKFTQEGRVELSVEQRHPAAAPEGTIALRFCVTDDGIGIPLDKQQQLFGRFNQLDASYSRRFGGTGLGLAISRSLAELMGGTIGFASRPGTGSSFWLDLALPAAKPGEDRVGNGPDVVPPPMRILVAEDNATNRVVARTLLEHMGQCVAFADDGAEAIRAVQTSKFDLILMDISMPVMDGMEATRRIRGMEGACGSLPIIALTAHAGRAEQGACLEAGCNEVLTKPLDPAALRAALHRWSAPRPARSDHRAEPGTPAPEPAYDQDGGLGMRLAELASQIGEEALPELIEASLEDLARHHGVLERLVQGESVDPDAARRVCHSLAGIAATFGATRLAGLARAQERLGSGIEPRSSGFRRLHEYSRTLEQALRRHSGIFSPTTASARQEG